jgi:hypothetical protein
MAGLHVPLSTLHRRPHRRRRMTRGHRGSLLLRCRAFSSLSSRRFIPAHPTFTRNRSMREASALTPTASPRLRRRPSAWPPHRTNKPATELVPTAALTHGRRGSCAAHRPLSVRFEPVLDLRGVRQRFLSYAFSSLLAGPGSSDSADPSRTLSGLLPPSRAFPRHGCPQLHQSAATDRR